VVGWRVLSHLAADPSASGKLFGGTTPTTANSGFPYSRDVSSLAAVPGPPGGLDAITTAWKLGGGFGLATLAIALWVLYPEPSDDPERCAPYIGGCNVTLFGPIQVDSYRFELFWFGGAFAAALIVMLLVHLGAWLLGVKSPVNFDD
jgi:hypothetical protein